MRRDFAARCGVNDTQSAARDWRQSRINDCHYSEAADWYVKMRAEFRLDIRTPANDRRLVAFCIGIPEDQYLYKGRDRWLIRRAMEGRLPEIVLNQRKCGAQAADWYPRLTRARNHIAEEVKRLAANPEVASILDMQRLKATLDSWPDCQPPEYTPGEKHLLAVPDALATGYFIENLTGTNSPGIASGNNMDQNAFVTGDQS
jgi:asparagine synthetase B (glutamine-hydrolysing)